MTKPASESPSESLVVPERGNESAAQGNKNPVQSDSAQSSPISEEQLREIEAANEEHRVDWRYPNQKDRIRALCRSLRAAWAERDRLRDLVYVPKIAPDDADLTYADEVARLLREKIALLEQLRTQRESITHLQENEKSLKAQLAQVEQGRELCRQVQKRGEHSSTTCPCIVAMERNS